MSETFDLRIDSIAAGGDGVGRHDGMVVFVPRTAPGDIARVTARTEGRLMRGRVASIVTASPQRVTPACEHYDRDGCGGCQLQHLSYAAQLGAKSDIIRDSLTRIGRLTLDAPAVEASDAPWHYRRKLTLKVRRRSGQTVTGLHRFDDPDAVFQLKNCRITDERVMQLWAAIMARTDLLPRASELRVAVRALTEGFAVVVEGGEQWQYEPFLSAFSPVVELWWEPQGKVRRSLAKRGIGAAFTQVNEGVASRLVAYVASVASHRPPATAIDAYAGTGDIAVALAALGARVSAIEIDRDAAAACTSRLPSNARVEAASVENALPKLLPAELVVVNPPRAGLTPVVADALQAASGKVKQLIYVSCDPGTLARDLKRMNKYRLVSVKGFDMFPQTAHVETVVALEPAA